MEQAQEKQRKINMLKARILKTLINGALNIQNDKNMTTRQKMLATRNRAEWGYIVERLSKNSVEL